MEKTLYYDSERLPSLWAQLRTLQAKTECIKESVNSSIIEVEEDLFIWPKFVPLKIRDVIVTDISNLSNCVKDFIIVNQLASEKTIEDIENIIAADVKRNNTISVNYVDYTEIQIVLDKLSQVKVVPQHYYNKSKGTVIDNKADCPDSERAAICTTVSIVQLINNYLALNGSDYRYTVEEAVEREAIKHPVDPYNYSVSTTYKVGNYTFTPQKVKQEAGKTWSETLVEQLKTHKEGVRYYIDGKHSVVIVGYRIDENGSIKFQAMDGSGCYVKNSKGEYKYSKESKIVDLEDTWLFHTYKGKNEDGVSLLNSGKTELVTLKVN